MYEANNNPQAQTADNEKGLDKTRRITEFFATEGSGSYTGFEDDGTTVVNTQDSSDEAYGTQNSISYGEHVSTLYTSEVSGGTGVFTINAFTGTYDGYDPVRVSTFVVNLSAEPTALVAKNGEQALELVEVADKAAFDATEPEAGQAIYLYDETPNLNTYCLEGEGFADTEITTTPKLYVKFAETDVSQTAQTLTVEGFTNAGELPNDAPNDALEAPVVSAVENANALGALIHFSDEQFEFVPGSIAAADVISGMSNRSVAKTSYNDGTQSVNLAFINEGDKDLYSGDDVVATFQLKAKVDTTVELDAATWTIGPLLDFTTGSTAASIDKSELQALVDAIKAEGLKAEDYTTATWTPFELALVDAERLLADEETTQETIDQCVKALQDAYDGLAKATVPSADADRDKLAELVATAEGLDTTGKTEESVARLQNTLQVAKNVLANEAATDEEIQSAYDDLKDAIDNLVDAAPVDDAHQQLSDLLAVAEGIDTTGKTAESATAFANAIAHAKEVLANSDATADELNAAREQLQAAIDGLKDETNVPPADGGDPSDKPSGDSGKDEPAGDQNAPSKDDDKPSASVDKNDGGQVPQTGDASVLLAAPAAVAGLAFLAAGSGSRLASRKRRK